MKRTLSELTHEEIEEIKVSYRDSKNKRLQISILSDLYCISTDTVKHIVADVKERKIPIIKPSWTLQSERCSRSNLYPLFLKYYNEGFNDVMISEAVLQETGQAPSHTSIASWRKRNGLEPSIRRRHNRLRKGG